MLTSALFAAAVGFAQLSPRFTGTSGQVKGPPAAVVRTSSSSFEDDIAATFAELERSETGALLAADARRLGVKVRPIEGGMFFTDSDNTVSVGKDYLSWPRWQFATLFAHELEHARQRSLGLTGAAARAYRELGAFFMQCRVWVELGGRSRDEDWEANRRNAQDMWAWTRFPGAVVSALTLRGEFEFPAHQAASDYWREVLRTERLWRETHPMPTGRDPSEAADAILRQARAMRERSGRP